MLDPTLLAGRGGHNYPAAGIEWQKILHGEQMMTIHQPLPPACVVVSETTVDEIYDKGADKGAVLYQTIFPIFSAVARISRIVAGHAEID